MKIYQYKCTLLSELIMTANSATQGFNASLDYIPGAKFLGLVANNLYDENNAQTLDLFHNGKVRFGDALPLINGEAMLKVPFAWFTEKGKGLTDAPIYLHHKINSASDIQLKQARNGYFAQENKKFITLEQNFAIKSGYDSEKRRSEDGLMYGYFSLTQGSTWTFMVETDNDTYAEKIKNSLVATHRIGRSRSAEYGLVSIEFMAEKAQVAAKNCSGEVVLYAESNLGFYDENGKATAQPTALQLTGDSNAVIDWTKSQIRTRSYQTWNRHRNNRDADRLIIEKGSVFVVKITSLDTAFFAKGVGAHRAEGFGKIQVNPDFLSSETEKLDWQLIKDVESKNNTISFAVAKGDKDDSILYCLAKRVTRNDFQPKIDELANAFYKDNKNTFSGISPSQWGMMRNYAKNANNFDYFNNLVFSEGAGFTKRGQSEPDWRKNGRAVKLEEYLKGIDPMQKLPFIIKLSNLMAKSN
jgi:hypothetical protein